MKNQDAYPPAKPKQSTFLYWYILRFCFIYFSILIILTILITLAHIQATKIPISLFLGLTVMYVNRLFYNNFKRHFSSREYKIIVIFSSLFDYLIYILPPLIRSGVTWWSGENMRNAIFVLIFHTAIIAFCYSSRVHIPRSDD
jgi:hypothetical protein